MIRDVIEAIPDKLGLAREWGLRVAERGRPSPTGWYPVHAIDRDDSKPSAALNIHHGFYVDLGSGQRLKFFELAVALGAYHTPQDAIRDLGDRFHVRSA